MGTFERQYRDAIRLVNVSQMSRDIDRPLRTLQSYAGGQRGVTADAAHEMISYLRERARLLTEAADKLEVALRDQEDQHE